MNKAEEISMAVIIPTYKRPKLLSRLLVSIQESNWPKSLLGIWVIENGVKDQAENIVNYYKSFFPITYYFVPTANLSMARNIGAIESKADICIFFDDDVRISKNTLVAYEAMIKKHGLKYFYGGPLYPDYESVPDEWLSSFLPSSAKGFFFNEKQLYLEEPFFLGGNHAIPIDGLKRVGMYDIKSASGKQNAGYLGEETRVQVKLNQLEFKGICVHDAIVWHNIPKENCTVDWILKRKFRLGKTDAEKFLNESQLFIGLPRWVLSAYLVNIFKILQAYILLKSKQQLFPLQLKSHYYKGILIECIKLHF